MSRQMTKPTFSRKLLRAETLLKAEQRTVTRDWHLHWHDFLELELIIDGHSAHVLNGQYVPLTRGRLILLRRTDYHSVQKLNGCTLLYLGLDESLIAEDILMQIEALPFVSLKLDETELQAMESLMQLCILENAAPKPDKRYLKHLLFCIFLRIINQLRSNHTLSNTVSKPIHTALLYIRIHFKDNPTLEEVATHIHYNKSYFSTLFHREIGVPFSVYINQLKVEYAKELLLLTDLSVSDVCFECGFASQTNFLRLFKEKMGTTPLQYRLQNKQ